MSLVARSGLRVPRIGGKFRRLFKVRHLKLALGGAIVTMLILIGLFAARISPFDPSVQDIKDKLRPPLHLVAGKPRHELGTDFLGRDILSRIVAGSRVSLLVGVVSVALAGLIGVVFGALGGFYGGLIDEIISKICEIFLAFPFLLLAIVIMAFLGPGLGNVVLALVLSRWVHFARVMRGELLLLKTRDHVTAARALGAGDLYLVLRHILPYTLPTLTVIATFDMALVIIYELSLSFLGLGVPASVPTWGSMLGEGRGYMHAAPWISIFPGLAIFLTVLGINLLGDGLRDALDPRLKSG